MEFALKPVPDGSALKVWIDYELPATGIGRVLPSLTDAYGQWCVDQMVADAASAFGRLDTAAPLKAERPAA